MTNFLSAFGVSLISTLVTGFCFLPASYAQTWSDMEVRNIKPGMTYADVEQIIADEWPQAKIRKLNCKKNRPFQHFSQFPDRAANCEDANQRSAKSTLVSVISRKHCAHFS